MKTVLSEWKHSPKACIYLVLSMLLDIISIILNGLVILKVSFVITNPQTFDKDLPIIVIIGISLSLIEYFSTYMKERARNLASQSIIDHYVDSIINADINLYIKYSLAHIQSMGEYCYKIVMSLMVIRGFIINIAIVITNFYFMSTISSGIIVLVICIYLVGAVFTKILFNKYDKIDTEWEKIRCKRNQEMENIVNGFMEIKIFGKKEIQKEKIHSMNKDATDCLYKKNVISGFINSGFTLIDSLILIGIMIYSTSLILDGKMEPAYAMVMITYAGRLLFPIQAMIDFVHNLSEQMANVKGFKEIISWKNNIEDGNINLSSFENEITIKEVNFSYDNSKSILRDINLKIQKGQKIGICGASGEGKSTLFKLLNRFYDPDSGMITIDDIPLQKIKDKSLRKILGNVSQENYIFPVTIKENIIYGTQYYTEEELIEACKKANIYDFIMSLDEKFDTLVGPKGLKLSGGQKQRIALARLLLVNPEIILLDEATSALDNSNEKFIQECINKLNNKTIITIAHRLGTIKDCDVIYVMKNGTIVEYGSHDVLLEKKGEYFKMYNKE